MAVLWVFFLVGPDRLEQNSCRTIGMLPQILLAAGAHMHCIDRIVYFVFLHTLAYHYAGTAIAYLKFSFSSWRSWRILAVCAFLGGCIAQQLILGTIGDGAGEEIASEGIVLHVARYLAGLGAAVLVSGLLYPACAAVPVRILELAGSGCLLTYFSHAFSEHSAEFFARVAKGGGLPGGVRQAWMMSSPLIYMALCGSASMYLPHILTQLQKLFSVFTLRQNRYKSIYS
jgi:hypothetical protein